MLSQTGYHELLKRYMAWIIRQEGISYISGYIGDRGEGPLSAVDVEKLRLIEAEVWRASRRDWEIMKR
jgi:hypothetical protein